MMFGIDSLYIWLAVIIISVAVEAFTLTLCGIWFAAGGVAALIAASLSVGLMGQWIVFIVFSALLLMNFMTVSLQARSYELGVLRALGAGRRDIFGICVTECLAVALIDFLLAMVATGVTSAIVNSYFGFAIFVPGLVSGGLLLAIVLIVSLASSFVPVLRVSSRTPAAALRV